MMSDNSNNLFVWKSHNKYPNNEPKSNQEPSLKYWQLQTVKATDNAIKSVFANSKNNVNTNTCLVDDTIYSEAKSLVKSWLTNKQVYGDFNDRQSFMGYSSEEADVNLPNRLEIHKEWEHLVNKIETKEDFKNELDSYLSTENDNFREDQKLKSVMSNLQKKTFVDSSKLRKINASKSIDMKKRIENRQESVKKNREERLKQEEMLKQEKLAQKEAHMEAMKMLKEEKKLKEASIKKEEELLQLEMNKIRAELQQKREQEIIEHKKMKETQDKLAKQEKKINSVRDLEEKTKILESKITKNANDRFKIISDFVEKKFLNKNIQLTRQCFRSWKNEVTKTKIKLEKAVVWFEWKTSRKVFRAWSQFSRVSKINMQIDMDQQRIKLMQMKETMASDFWKRNLLKKCIINWSLYVIDEKESRWCQKLEEMRKKKMVAYIEALQEKAFENQEKLEILSLEASKNVNNNRSFSLKAGIQTDRTKESDTKIPENNDCCKSARLVTSKPKSKEAWQITKKDVWLPLDRLVDNPNHDKKSTECQQMKSLKPPKVVNSFAHRDAAQKELIKQQQMKIKEQQRLIEEIKCNQFIKQIKEDRSDYNASPKQDNEVLHIDLQSNYNEDVKEDDSAKLQNTKNTSKFVLQMEARAKERQKIKAERRERQLKIEEEKKMQLNEKLVEQTKLELEEKIKREKLLKEKKEKEKQKEDAKKKKLKWEQCANEKADQFYKSLLMKHYGVNRWSKLLIIKNESNERAHEHHQMIIVRKVFDVWWKEVKKEITYRDQIIRSFYDLILTRRCFHHMKLFKHRHELMEQTAEKHYLESLEKRYFRQWRLTNHREQIRLDKLTVQSQQFYDRSLMQQLFDLWRQLPMATRIERERERRKQIMRQKVASIIPDFTPKDFVN